MRIKVPAKRRDSDFFRRTEQEFSGLDGVQQARANAETASLLLLHSGTRSADVRAFASSKGLFTLERAPGAMVLTVWEAASTGIGTVNKGLQGLTGGAVDMRSALFMGLLLMAVRQLKVGNIAGPAVTLLWYALQLLNTPWRSEG